MHFIWARFALRGSPFGRSKWIWNGNGNGNVFAFHSFRLHCCWRHHHSHHCHDCAITRIPHPFAIVEWYPLYILCRSVYFNVLKCCHQHHHHRGGIKERVRTPNNIHLMETERRKTERSWPCDWMWIWSGSKWKMHFSHLICITFHWHATINIQNRVVCLCTPHITATIFGI